jgi:hypothetical protein
MSVRRRFGADEKPHCCVTRFAWVSDAFESERCSLAAPIRLAGVPTGPV